MIGVIDVGGGLRGIFGAGVLDCCIDNDILFDYAIGVSAGSANLASYFAEQKGRNYVYYTNYAFRKEYMSFGEFIKNKNYVNLDYVYGTLSNSNGEFPLHYKKMIDRINEFKIVATDAITGKPFYFDKSNLIKDDYGPFKCSSCLPVACKPYYWNGRSYFDGGLTDPIPIKKAFEDGCEKVVVILTKPKNFFRNNKTDRRMALVIKKKFPNVANALNWRADTYNQELKKCLELEKQGKVLIVAPDNIEGMNTLTKDKEKVKRLYQKGYNGGKAVKKFVCE